ncbi:nucleotidyltransferase [soil metagenome]
MTIPELKIAEFCQRNHIRKLALFGSVLRDDFRADSDIDVLVEFYPDAHVGWEFIALQDELSELFGRTVDLHTFKALNKPFLDKVQQASQVIYERTRSYASARYAEPSPLGSQISPG